MCHLAHLGMGNMIEMTMSLRLHTGVVFDHVIGRLLTLNLTNGQVQEMVDLEFRFSRQGVGGSLRNRRVATQSLKGDVIQ
jgi:hypothetical protein